MNKVLLTTLGASLAIVAASAAHALEAKISGQVSRAIMLADDGVSSDTYHVDNVNSSTRFRFTGTQDIGGGLKAGIKWEVEFRSNPSSAVNQNNKSTGGTTFGERHAQAFLAGDFGKVSLGQGDGAANAATEIDLSGTDIINYSDPTNLGGSLQFRTGAGALSGITISNVTSNLDFESRYDVLRYDTPALGPVTFSANVGTSATGGGQDVKEVALRYSSALAGGKLAAAVGHSIRDAGGATGDVKTTGGSVSWLAPGGISVTLANSSRKNDASLDASYKYVKVGYKTGKHAVSVDYGKGDDEAANGDEAKVMGVGYVYKPVKAVDLLAGYKVHSLERPGSTFQDISILTVGLRVKF